MIGEFFASPAIALADSAVIQSLGEKQVATVSLEKSKLTIVPANYFSLTNLSFLVNIPYDLSQDKYGAQRMFGSIGWGVCMFVMGIVLDYSTLFPTAK